LPKLDLTPIEIRIYFIEILSIRELVFARDFEKQTTIYRHLMAQALTDKIAIVTGAGQGIGKGVALRLASAGAHLVIAEYNPETAEATCAEIRALGRSAIPVQVDLSNVGQIQPMIDRTVQEFGRIDILVNNAGRMQTKPMLDLTQEDWDRVVDTNQRGLFFCLQAAARQMIAQIPEEIRSADRAPHSFGKIVNFSSVASRSGRPYATHYAAAKAAVNSITKSAALALAKYNINVNAVAPGVVPTPMWEQIDQERGMIFGAKPGESIRNVIEQTIPLKRASSVDDLAGVVVFLCSLDADYITGQCLNVDGGIEMD
jgi:meso-butanediol dehydrogenase / (S,S)-butanediol dehydrogenase / diacetyl reductase